jgi:hypothetical protein
MHCPRRCQNRSQLPSNLASSRIVPSSNTLPTVAWSRELRSDAGTICESSSGKVTGQRADGAANAGKVLSIKECCLTVIRELNEHLGVYEDSTHLVVCQKPVALYYGRRSFTTCAVSSLLRQVSVGEGVPLPTPRIQVVHGTVPQKCARTALPAPSGILSRPALRELRCHPLPTSSTRAPEVTPN